MTAKRGEISINTAIEFREVDKSYRLASSAQRVVALGQANIEVMPGEFVSIVGKSGCGKTTALKLAAGLVPPDTGDVLINGTPARAGRRDVGLMLQSSALLPWRTVFENVALPFKIFGDLDRERAEQCRQMLKTVGLGDNAGSYPWQLSGGMQRRVSLARLLVYRPSIALMDEPFTGLDEFTRETLTFELARIHEAEGITVLFVTHSIQEAVTLSDRVIVMRPGLGHIAGELTVNLPRPRTRDIISSPEFISNVNEVRGLLGLDSGGVLDP